MRKLEREHAERGRRRKNTSINSEEIALAVAAEERSFKARRSSKERSASLPAWQQNASFFADGRTGAQHNLASGSAENAASSDVECTASAKPSSSSEA